jgi:hypothetical protein
MIKDLMDAKILNGLNLMAFDYGLDSFNVENSPRLTAPGESALYAISAANSAQELFKTQYGMDDQQA